MKLLKDQVESLRYVNHLWPVLILRVYAAFFFLSRYYEKSAEGYLSQPKISAAIDEFLYTGSPPAWIESFFVNYVQKNWELSASMVMNLEWFFGALLLIGFLNRPVAIFSLIFLYVMSFISSPVEQAQFASMIAILAALMVFGSGRVGGIDYFFYKRRRGLVW